MENDFLQMCNKIKCNRDLQMDKNIYFGGEWQEVAADCRCRREEVGVTMTL